MEKDPLLPRYDWRIGSEVSALPGNTSSGSVNEEEPTAEAPKPRINLKERLVSLDAVRGFAQHALAARANVRISAVASAIDLRFVKINHPSPPPVCHAGLTLIAGLPSV